MRKFWYWKPLSHYNPSNFGTAESSPLSLSIVQIDVLLYLRFNCYKVTTLLILIFPILFTKGELTTTQDSHFESAVFENVWRGCSVSVSFQKLTNSSATNVPLGGQWQDEKDSNLRNAGVKVQCLKPLGYRPIFNMKNNPSPTLPSPS